jgi:hypothetical protein
VFPFSQNWPEYWYYVLYAGFKVTQLRGRKYTSHVNENDFYALFMKDAPSTIYMKRATFFPR